YQRVEAVSVGKHVDGRTLRDVRGANVRLVELRPDVDAAMRDAVVVRRRRAQTLEAPLVRIRCDDAMDRHCGIVVDPHDILVACVDAGLAHETASRRGALL